MGIFAKSFAEGLRPVELTTVSEWADKYRYLSRKTANEPGRWRTDRTPYLREIMDECSTFVRTKKVVIMKGSQLGVSEAITNVCGWVIKNDPSQIIYLLPTEFLAKKIARTKFEPMIDDSPDLAKLVGKSAENPLSGKEEKNSETILVKEFINGAITFGSAASPNSLSTVSAKLLIMDETDRYETDVKAEGNPIALAENRVAAMSRHKIILLSTPKIAGESIIESEFEESDKRYYFIPCPHCKEEQVLELDNFRYEMDEATRTASDAWFECKFCEKRIEESKKAWFLPLGRYKPTAKGSCVGFHISGFYAPLGWRGWREIATMFNRARTKKDENLLKTFYNTVLGLTWAAPSARPEWEKIRETMTERQPGIVPKECLVLTAGVDVQGDRLECQVTGFSPDGHTYVVDYQIFSGDTSSDAPWNQLEAYLRKDLPSEIPLVSVPISMTCIDSGYRTTKVYAFIRRFLPGRKVVAIKGKDDLIVPVARPTKFENATSGGVNDRRGIEMFPLGVSVIKQKIYDDIQARPNAETGELPSNFVHFPELPVEYFKQLTAEESKITLRKGKEQRQWSLVYRRNEALDCFCYSTGAYYILGIHRYTAKQWGQIRDMLFPAQRLGEDVTLRDVGKPPVHKQKIKKSSFWGD